MRLLELINKINLLKLNYRGITINGQDGGDGAFRWNGLVQAVLHDDGGIVRHFRSTRHRLGVHISKEQKKENKKTCHRTIGNWNYIII